MESCRPLSESERRLARWMLENGSPEAKEFLAQIDHAEVTPEKCSCGCASISFRIRGLGEAPAGVHVLSDFAFEDGPDQSGIMIYESGGILSGMEVYGFTGDAPKSLPS